MVRRAKRTGQPCPRSFHIDHVSFALAFFSFLNFHLSVSLFLLSITFHPPTSQGASRLVTLTRSSPSCLQFPSSALALHPFIFLPLLPVSFPPLSFSPAMIANLPILALLAVSTSSAFAGRQGPSRLSQRHRQVQQGRRDNATVSSGSNATEPLDFEATGGAFNATGGGIATFSSNATIFGNSTFGNNTAFGNNATEGGFPIPTSSPLPVEEQPSSEPEQTGSEDDLPWCDEVDVDEANEGDNAASASGAEEQQPTAASSGSSDGTSTADAPAPTVDAAASCDAASTPVVHRSLVLSPFHALLSDL